MEKIEKSYLIFLRFSMRRASAWCTSYSLFVLVHKPRKLLWLILCIFQFHRKRVEVQVHADCAGCHDVLDLDLGLDCNLDADFFKALNDLLDALLNLFHRACAR